MTENEKKLQELIQAGGKDLLLACTLCDTFKIDRRWIVEQIGDYLLQLDEEGEGILTLDAYMEGESFGSKKVPLGNDKYFSVSVLRDLEHGSHEIDDLYVELWEYTISDMRHMGTLREEFNIVWQHNNNDHRIGRFILLHREIYSHIVRLLWPDNAQTKLNL